MTRVHPAAEKLKNINWRRHNVLFAVLHGSILWSPTPRDIDILVAPAQGFSEDDEIAIIEEVEALTGLPADLHVVNPDDPNCPLFLEALRHGVLVYLEGERGVDELTRLALICWDYTVMRRKIGFTKLLVESVMRRGGAREAPRARG